MRDSLRDYQNEAVQKVRRCWDKRRNGAVCLVAPTGAGKTVMGEACIESMATVLWVAHRRDLVIQTAKRLEKRFGNRVGVAMPGERENTSATIRVGTIQTLLARRKLPADCLVLDEAHHYVSDEWRIIRNAYPSAKVVGLTATPERADGTPLGDLFSELVIAASYSRLLKEGFLVPARVHRPAKSLGNDLAQEPVEAWRKFSEGSRAFVFCARTSIARATAKKFRDAGVLAAVIEASTSSRERAETLEAFRQGRVRVIANVGTMTEGIDVPEARTVILMRSFDFVGTYLQVVGRVLRPTKGKPDAILIDLTGTSIKHGLPTDDREYSLTGNAISGEGPGGGGVAPEFAQKVCGVEMMTVARGALVVDEPIEQPLSSVNDVERKAEYQRLVVLAKRHRLRLGVADAKYFEKFGEWPREAWR